MIQLAHESGGLSLTASHYRLVFAADRPFVSVYDASGELLCELFVPSSIHPLRHRDDTVHLGPWQAEIGEEEILLRASAQSSVWEEKEYRFRCYPHRFVYEVTVTGNEHLAEVHAFGGYYSANVRWGSGFFPSGQSFKQAFNPEPNVAEENIFSPAHQSAIDLMGVPLPSRGDWFFTPPPFAFAFASDNHWVAVGVAAEPGENSFTALRYAGRRDSFFLTLDYEGYTAVSGRYELPAISFDFAMQPDESPAANPYEALSAHAHALRAQGLVPSPAAPQVPSWWLGPIFCGWGSQCHLASQNGGHAPDYARQAQYEEFITILEREQIAPSIIVLDDKWQDTYGENEVDVEKWPDLPGFIRSQHVKGRRVLLWLKAWDREGVPVEECITNAAGLPIAVDPTNPAFQERLRRSVHHMLSPEGYNADGFKIDFTARIPSGPCINHYGPAWGLELMKLYLKIIYDEAKRTKPEALVMTHTPHPYLADVLDMIRLNDMNVGKDIRQAMQHRASIAQIACPNAIIDTDNWPITDKKTWRNYLQLQAKLGVPSLYYSSHVDATGEALEAADYELLREVWKEYSEQQVEP